VNIGFHSEFIEVQAENAKTSEKQASVRDAIADRCGTAWWLRARSAACCGMIKWRKL